MSISEGNTMEECRNGTFLLQDHTSVDTLIGKWLKEDTKPGSKSCSDEMMDVEISTTTEEPRKMSSSNISSDDIQITRKEDPEVDVLDTWAQVTSFYEMFKAAIGPEKFFKAQEKESQFKARKRFENWFDIFLVRALTLPEEDWHILLKKTSEKGVLMSDVIRSNVVEYLMEEVRNLCLHFEAYKDLDPLRSYLFGKGWRILKILCRIESVVIQDLKMNRMNLASSASTRVQSKEKILFSEKTVYDKEFMDLLLHLFEVS